MTQLIRWLSTIALLVFYWAVFTYMSTWYIAFPIAIIATVLALFIWFMLGKIEEARDAKFRHQEWQDQYNQQNNEEEDIP